MTGFPSFLNAVIIFHYTYTVFTVFYNGYNRYYVSTNNVQRIPFSQHAHQCLFFKYLFDMLHSLRCEVSPCGYNLHFCWWLVMLSLFSYIYWSFVHLLRNVSSDPLSNFKPGFLLSICVPYIYIYTLDINSLSDVLFGNIFSHSVELSLHSVVLFVAQENFTLMQSSISHLRIEAASPTLAGGFFSTEPKGSSLISTRRILGRIYSLWHCGL